MNAAASSRTTSGFTLIELLTVISIVGLLAAIAVPNLISSRTVTNEGAAIATLRNLATVQQQVHNRGFIDIDLDGAGEFGFFGELSGGVPPRNQAGQAMVPPLLSSSFSAVQAGQVSRSGYFFRIYLPDANGVGLEESAANYAQVDSDQAESFWCCYAWPRGANQNGGRRVFFINQQGEVLWSDNTVQGYQGTATVPPADAVFNGANPGGITGSYVTGQAASDGGTWRPIDG